MLREISQTYKDNDLLYTCNLKKKKKEKKKKNPNA